METKPETPANPETLEPQKPGSKPDSQALITGPLTLHPNPQTEPGGPVAAGCAYFRAARRKTALQEQEGGAHPKPCHP